MAEIKPLSTMPGKKWQPMEVFNLRARYPETCWEPWLSQVCALPAGHHGYHGWSTRVGVHSDGRITPNEGGGSVGS